MIDELIKPITIAMTCEVLSVTNEDATKPYWSLMWTDNIASSTNNVGYSSYNPEFVLKWLRDHFVKMRYAHIFTKPADMPVTCDIVYADTVEINYNDGFPLLSFETMGGLKIKTPMSTVYMISFYPRED